MDSLLGMQPSNNILLQIGTRNMKIIILIVLFILTTIFCFLPQIILNCSNRYEIANAQSQFGREEVRKRKRRKRFRKNAVSIMNCFASGVFLGVCLLDLLPEVEENIDEFMSTYMANIKFPLPQFCVVIGFLLLLILEQVATLCRKDAPNPFSHHHHHHHDDGVTDSLMSSTASTIPSSRRETIDARQQLINESINNFAPSDFASHPDDNTDGYDNVQITPPSIPNSHHHHHHHHDHHELIVEPHPPPNNDDDDYESVGENSRLLEKPEDKEDAENLAELEEAEIEDMEVPTDPRAHSNVRYIMLAIALSVHSIFEGLALGLEPKMSSVFQLFVAIAIHKCVVAFSFGLNMSQSSLNVCTKFSSLIVFCLASPVGAIIGLGVEMVSFDKGTAGGIIGSLQGLACGSFIYVVFFELLPHEFFTYRRRPSPLLKVLALILGVTLMSVVMLIAPV